MADKERRFEVMADCSSLISLEEEQANQLVESVAHLMHCCWSVRLMTRVEYATMLMRADALIETYAALELLDSDRATLGSLAALLKEEWRVKLVLSPDTLFELLVALEPPEDDEEGC
jgi:hypothetical protein